MKKVLSLIALCVATLSFAWKASAETPLEVLFYVYGDTDEHITCYQWNEDEVEDAIVQLENLGMDFEDERDNIRRISYFYVERGIPEDALNPFLEQFQSLMEKDFEDDEDSVNEEEGSASYVREFKEGNLAMEEGVFMQVDQEEGYFFILEIVKLAS